MHYAPHVRIVLSYLSNILKFDDSVVSEPILLRNPYILGQAYLHKSSNVSCFLLIHRMLYD